MFQDSIFLLQELTENSFEGIDIENKPGNFTFTVNPNTGGLESIGMGYSGSGYFSSPIVTVEDSSGSGVGAKVRPVLNRDINGNFSPKKFFNFLKKINFLNPKSNKNYTDKSEVINEYIPQDEIKNLIQEDL